MPYDAAGKEAAKAYVAEVRAATVCERCGSQPIEWHNIEHEANPNNRVAGLAARGHPIERIQREIDASEALCRSCHMAIDGRTAALAANHPRRKGDIIVPPVPCAECGTPTRPSWRGKCRRCYDRERRS